jgi:hypothetical protein
MELKENFDYFNGSFEGIFRKKNSTHVGSLIFSEINWQHITITEVKQVSNFNPDKHKVGDYWYSKKIWQKKWYLPAWLLQSSDIFIPKNEVTAFSGDLHHVIIKDLELDSANKLPFIQEISQNLLLVRGTIYFGLPKPPPLVVQPSSPLVTDASQKNVDNQVSGRIQGINILGDVGSSAEHRNTNVLNSVEQNGCWRNFINSNKERSLLDPISQTPKRQFGFFSLLSSLFFASLWGLALIYLWFSFPQFFWPLLISGVLWLLFRILKWRVLSNRLGWILMLAVIYFWIQNYKTAQTDLIPKETKNGSIKTDPPKETESSSNVKDYISAKEIKWWDFFDKNYFLNFSTSAIKYFDSKANREKAQNYNKQDQIEFFTQTYRSMVNYDTNGLDSVITLLNLQAEKKKLNPIQKAEMVVTFIQEIPYYLVHDMSCADARKTDPGGFLDDYHRKGKPCMPNIFAGVQSPYEFLHNLKGDCDTRSVLGYSILTEMHIPASVWVSEAYGHSVLGVGLPVGTGSYKEIDGMKHYAVELTSKGYRLGMISASNRNMNNWTITLYKNN